MAEMSKQEMAEWLQRVCNGAIDQEAKMFNLIFPKNEMEKDELLQGTLVCYMLGQSAKIQDPEAWELAKDVFHGLIGCDVEMEAEE